MWGPEPGLGARREVPEVVLVEPHPVPLPAETALHLGEGGGGLLPVGDQGGDLVVQLVRVRDVALVEGEMVGQ